MIADIRIAVVFFFVGAIPAGHAVAQEDGRVLRAAEEIPAPPIGQKLLDFVPAETSNSRFRKTGNRLVSETSTTRVNRITDMLAELKKKARSREAVRRVPTESHVNQSREPSFTEPPPPALPPIVNESKKQNKIEANLVIQQTRPTLKTTPVSLTTTVDSLSLANNLFAQGKVEMAQQIYEKLQKTPHSSSDLIWIQYQLACCHRITGRTKKATQLYRVVGSSKSETYWASRANWWLDYLGRAQRLEAQRQKLESQFEVLKKAAKNVQAK